MIASLIFYGFTNYVYLIYLGASSLISYVAGLLSQKKHIKDNKTTLLSEKKRYQKFITILAIIVNVGVLTTLKYYNFFANSFTSLFHFSTVTYNFIIPLGISFYTFSLAAYNVDCFKNEIYAERNPLKFLLFVSYFPKILQGPISNYDTLKKDGLFCSHNFVDIDYLKCFFRISVGLVKKIVIANVLNIFVNASFANIAYSRGGWLILTSIFYTIQLFCDFSGFADITIGISGLFGIKMEENFDTPYMSSSIQMFWRKWHITLGNWLKKYIYIPLGGNRVPIWRWAINTLIVWLISGLWHGANWTFIVWGLFHGVLLVVSGLPNQIKKKHAIVVKEKHHNPFLIFLSISLTMALVNLGWIFFRSSSISDAMLFISNACKIWEPSSYNAFSDSSIIGVRWMLFVSLGFTLILVALKFSFYHKSIIFSKITGIFWIKRMSLFVITVLFFSASIFIFLVLKSNNAGGSSFIYFDF